MNKQRRIYTNTYSFFDWFQGVFNEGRGFRAHAVAWSCHKQYLKVRWKLYCPVYIREEKRWRNQVPLLIIVEQFDFKHIYHIYFLWPKRYFYAFLMADAIEHLLNAFPTCPKEIWPPYFEQIHSWPIDQIFKLVNHLI